MRFTQKSEFHLSEVAVFSHKETSFGEPELITYAQLSLSSHRLSRYFSQEDEFSSMTCSSFISSRAGCWGGPAEAGTLFQRRFPNPNYYKGKQFKKKNEHGVRYQHPVHLRVAANLQTPIHFPPTCLLPLSCFFLSGKFEWTMLLDVSLAEELIVKHESYPNTQ